VRVAPIARNKRELSAALGDEDREGVDDEERPDDERDRGEDEQERVDERQRLPDRVLRLLGGRGTGDGLEAFGQHLVDGGLELVLRDVTLPGHPHVRVHVLPAEEELLGVAGLEDGDRGADEPTTEVDRPHERGLGPGRVPRGEDRDGITDDVPRALRGDDVEDHLTGLLRPRAAREGAELAAVGGRATGVVDPRAPERPGRP
jgi:hypothetical protein